MGSIISENQIAFIPNRNMMDGVLILNEVVYLHAKTRKNSSSLKLILKKLSTRCRGDYLFFMLKHMHFGARFINWIQACVCSTLFSILVNRSPTIQFQEKWGLYQGDPLSLFLFNIVTKGLADLLKNGIMQQIFHLFKIFKNLHFDFLQFADDTIILGESNWGFKLVFGLRVNFIKSSIFGFNLDLGFLEAASHFLFFSTNQMPFKFWMSR